MGKIDIYGWGGVNTTKNPIQLENNELTKAQNAIRDAAGEHGALRKRPGLTKINSIALSGSVLGFVNVPLDLVTVRRFLIGVDQAITTAYQWITSVDAFSNSATSTTPGACSRVDGAHPILNSFEILSNRGIQVTDQLFLYPGDYTRGAAQPVRAYDGTVDRELFRVPLNTKALTSQGAASYALRDGQILDWVLVGDKLYFVSLDYIHIGTANYSTVYEYDLTANTLRQIGEGAGIGAGDLGDGGVVFTCLAYHQGYLYAGVGQIDSNSTASGVYRIRPGEANWTYDFDNSGAGDADQERPMCMESYGGLLYVGMHDTNSTSARMMVRSATGTYSQSTTVGNGTGSGWTDMKVFGDNLYACAWDNNGASSITTIRKFDGSSWTTVKTIDTGIAAPHVGIEMVINNGRLFVLAVDSAKDGLVTHSADGTSWTDHTTNLTNSDITSVFGVLET